ncbi:hypothetical protein BZG35_01110 [Brevundimonas sp. LM2]|nr:hypothetical protein BZG35_01110 [Brevundimonas sp. LM2]
MRRAIRDAALELFHERGFDSVTTTDVARQAGVTQRTLFRYFETKEALLFDGLDIHDWFASAMRRHDVSDPYTRIRCGLEDLADAYDAHAAILRRHYEIISACPGLEQAQSRHNGLIDRELATVIRTSFDAPSALAADVAAGAVLGLMRPIIRAWLLCKLEGPMRPYADRAWPTIARLIDEGLACGAGVKTSVRDGTSAS